MQDICGFKYINTINPGVEVTLDSKWQPYL
jgi:hypothetical protein